MHYHENAQGCGAGDYRNPDWYEQPKRAVVRTESPESYAAIAAPAVGKGHRHHQRNIQVTSKLLQLRVLILMASAPLVLAREDATGAVKKRVDLRRTDPDWKAKIKGLIDACKTCQ